MKLGLHIYDFTWPGGASQLGPTLVQIAQTADAWGFDRISVGDHVWQSPYLGGPEREVLSCYAHPRAGRGRSHEPMREPVE